jgi:hypothetical protein
MKIAPNRPTEEQKKQMDMLSGRGYRCEVCYSWVDAVNVLIDYTKSNLRRL